MSDLEVVPFFEESYIKMSMYDTANLVNDVFFETEIFPDVFWVPYSTLGKSEIIFTEDKIKSLKKSLMLNGIKGVVTSGQDPTQLSFQLVKRN